MDRPRGADVIVVGAGSAGATIASRLSEDPSRRVLLVEAGDDYRAEETPEAVRSGDFLRALAMRRFHWPALLARPTDWQPPRSYPAGRGVGGSSVINGQSAVRGLPGDFDDWASLGCPGWSWADVGGSFRRLEHDLDYGEEPFHGATGPLPVERVAVTDWNEASHALAAAAAARGHPRCADLNAPGSTGISPVAWNRRHGARVSTKDAYLEPARGRRNLEIVANVLAVRAVFHRRRCTGVEVTTAGGPAVLGTDHLVLCAGALHSPAFLLRSGIGPSQELQALDIPVTADLPGVGRNLGDHPTIWISFPPRAGSAGRSRPTDALPGHCALRYSSDPGAARDDLQLYATERRGRSGSSGAIMVALLGPRSTGRVRLRSAGATVAPDLELAMLTEGEDVRRLANGLREASILLSGPELRSLRDGPPRLLSGLPLADFDCLDSEETAALLRATCISYNHAAGTCRMGAASDPTAVVDARGSVFGVSGLTVADASVMPRIVRAPTHLTTVMVAEHLAAMLGPPARQKRRQSSCEVPEAANTPSQDQIRA